MPYTLSASTDQIMGYMGHVDTYELNSQQMPRTVASKLTGLSDDIPARKTTSRVKSPVHLWRFMGD